VTRLPGNTEPTPAVHDWWAFWSVVLGILWVGGLGSLLAIIFGTVSRRKARRAQQTTSVMSTVGLVLGWIGLVAGVIQWWLVAGLLTTPA
jgi:hypothetical protein